jgi:ribosomal protein L11 methyltransferase
MKKKSEKNDDGCILTLQVAGAEADVVAERLRELWNVEPVQLCRPDGEIVWIEGYFGTSVEALLAAKVAGRWRETVASSLRGYTSKDWRAYWRKHFRPMDIGETLRIVPVWEKMRSGGRRRTVRINPGLSFGTGDHFTTRFCLEMVEKVCGRKAPASFLDIGTGSGILAISAARLGVPSVKGVDFDPQCVEEAKANAGLNRLAARCEFAMMDISKEKPDGKYEVVCANLYGRLLADAAPSLVKAASRLLILSGMTETEGEVVAEACMRAGMREVVRDGDGNWCGLMFEKTRKH